MATRHWLILSLTTGIGPRLGRRLIERCDDVAGACEANANVLASVEGIASTRAPAIAASLRDAHAKADAELEKANQLGVQIISEEDDAFPFLLKQIIDPPLVMYLRGTLEPRDLNCVALVGSRKCSIYGREQADRFAGLLAQNGVTVASGGARGIDTAAHRGALKVPGGRTIAVLGSGLDVPYPAENRGLFDEIAASGAMLSEFPLSTQPTPENFPRRNRIVSGLSRGVVVIEADERSGALITARLACDDQNRPVFAVPGQLNNPLAAGPHKLIRDGATLVTNASDILEHLGPLPAAAMEHDSTVLFPPPQPARPPLFDLASLTPVQQQILQALDGGVADVDLICERSGLTATRVLGELTLLGIRGLVRKSDRGYERIGAGR